MWFDNYITMEDLITTLGSQKNSDLLEQLINACDKAITDYRHELHDTKTVTSNVLEMLGKQWVVQLEQRTQQEDSASIVRTLPERQRDRTRLLKYTIRYVLQNMYEKNPRFKYYQKYNQKSPNAYQVWKDTQYNK